jgi:glycyl-tRNA synthetase
LESIWSRIDNKDSKKRYRADVLIEDYAEKLNLKAKKEIEKARERFGDAFDEAQYKATNPRVMEYLAKEREILERMGRSLGNGDLEDVKALIEELEIACPDSGSRNWTEVRQFNLMFGTKLGASAEGAMDLYLRPETAQGIFVNFANVQKSGRMKIPFGIAQTGKAFRNEIVARQFIFRMREFEQMEMQFFVRPGEEMQWYEHWKATRLKWHLSLGLGEKNYRFHDHEKLAHYANAAADIEFNFPFGFKELEGIHSRTDFDLKAHEKFSGRKLQYFDAELNQNYVPYVVETSVGLDRMFLAVFATSLQEEILEDGSTRTLLKLPSVLAPTKIAVLPLIKRDGLPEKAKEILADLRWDFTVAYDEKDAVGRRYRRQDALGTPFCVTVDHQTLEDNTVTIRHRDSMQQDRVAITDLKTIVENEVSMKNWLKKMG